MGRIRRGELAVSGPALHPCHARSKIQKPGVSSTEGSEENEDCDLRLRHSFAIRHSGFVILLIRVVGEIRGQK
jgi:hypothetical protein